MRRFFHALPIHITRKLQTHLLMNPPLPFRLSRLSKSFKSTRTFNKRIFSLSMWKVMSFKYSKVFRTALFERASSFLKHIRLTQRRSFRYLLSKIIPPPLYQRRESNSHAQKRIRIPPRFEPTLAWGFSPLQKLIRKALRATLECFGFELRRKKKVLNRQTTRITQSQSYWIRRKHERSEMPVSQLGTSHKS